jgi:hypothetical protein
MSDSINVARLVEDWNVVGENGRAKIATRPHNTIAQL